jgi:DNA polymerase III alpha subunit
MRTDNYGRLIFTETDICDMLLKDPTCTLSNVLVEDKILFNSDIVDINTIPKLVEYVGSDLSVSQFDKTNQNNWNMPVEYKNLDIAKYILDQCSNSEELQRAGQELLLFQEREMFPLLQYLKYLVDTMRKHDVVWGVGRGSSVASFVLFLLGVHKINSLYYDLSIDEFLK